MKLNDDLFSAIQHLTSSTHLDGVMDIEDMGDYDIFIDFENDNCEVSIEDGAAFLYDAIAYPLDHENLNIDEINEIVQLFRCCEIGGEDYYEWLYGRYGKGADTNYDY